MDDVSEQATGARTELTIKNCAEKLLRPVGRSFPFDRAGLTHEHCPLFFGPSIVIFQRRIAAKRMYFYFPRKVLLAFTTPFFITFRAKSFRPHGPNRLFFFSACASNMAQRGGRTRRSFRV
jgi:hypothetical protein